MLGRLPSALKTSPGEVAISGNQWQSEAIALMTSSGEAFASSPNHWSISVHALSAFVFTSMHFATCAEDDNQGRSEALTDNQGSSQGQTREIKGDQARCIEIKGYLLLRRAVERAHARLELLVLVKANLGVHEIEGAHEIVELADLVLPDHASGELDVLELGRELRDHALRDRNQHGSSTLASVVINPAISSHQ